VWDKLESIINIIIELVDVTKNGTAVGTAD